MNVLIKGMEMPTGCLSCDFCNPFVDEPYCRRLMRRARGCTRLDDCPLVPVPPHGRLIDADALINALQELYDRRKKDAEHTGWRGAFVGWNDAICYIKDAPTIIEAEEGEAALREGGQP